MLEDKIREILGDELFEEAILQFGEQHVLGVDAAVRRAIERYYRKMGLLGEDEEDFRSVATNSTILDWVEMYIYVTNNDEDRLPTEVYWPVWLDFCEERGLNPHTKHFLNKRLGALGYDVGHPAYVAGTTKRCWMGAVLLDTS